MNEDGLQSQLQGKKCVNCPCWQGNRYSKWEDCYRVIAELEPRLLEFKSRQGTKLTVPFDPHDVKYFIHNPQFYRLYKKLVRSKLPDGVRVHKVTRSDTVFDPQSGEFGQVRAVPLYYFQVRKDYRCGYTDDV